MNDILTVAEYKRRLKKRYLSEYIYKCCESAIYSTKATNKRVFTIDICKTKPEIWSESFTTWKKYSKRSYSRNNIIRVVVSQSKRNIKVVTVSGNATFEIPKIIIHARKSNCNHRVYAKVQIETEGKLHTFTENRSLPQEEKRYIYLDFDETNSYIWCCRNSQTDIEIDPLQWRLIKKVAQMNGWELSYDKRLGIAWKDSHGEEYHIGDGTRISSWRVYEAKSAFIRREQERRHIEKRKEADRILNEKGWDILVSVADSIAAGNCEIGTQDFLCKLETSYGLTTNILDAQTILAIRDDDFTRRACRVAALKCG